MQRYILVRGFHSIIALIAVSIIVFGLGRLSGDPLSFMLHEDATEEEFQRAAEHWGLDRPLTVQYFTYMGNVLRGDFGNSLRWPGRSAGNLVVERLPATLQLAAVSMFISAIIALPIGVIVAVNKDTPVDYLGKVIALLGQSLPSFWLGLMLMWVFAVYLGLLPAAGREGWKHMLLPAITLGWFQVAAVMRLTRSAMLEVLDTEFVKLARVKGISEVRVVWKHCLRNALIAPITYFGLIFGAFMTGSVIVETVFSWPGVGLLAIEAVRARDFQVMQTVVLLFAVIYIGASLLVDILYAYLDPRIRYST